MVRVKIRQRRHRQNFPRARTNHDPGDAHRGMFLHPIGQTCLYDVLDHRINRQHDIQPILWFHVLFPHRDHLTPAPIGFRHPPAAHSRQFGIKRRFYPFLAYGLFQAPPVAFLIPRPDKSHHVGRQRSPRIHPQLIFHRFDENCMQPEVPIKCLL